MKCPSKEIFSTPQHIYLDDNGKTIDVRDPKSRNENMQCLFNSMTNKSYQLDGILGFITTPTHAYRFVSNLLVLDIINNQKKMQSTLRSLSSRFDFKKTNHPHESLNLLICIVQLLTTDNQLIFDHIFYSSNDVLWKALYEVMIKVALSFDPRKCVGTNAPKAFMALIDLLNNLIQRSYEIHLKFAIDIGLCKLLKHFWLHGFRCRYDTLKNSTIIHVHNDLSRRLYKDIEYRLAMFNKHNDIFKYWRKALRIEFHREQYSSYLQSMKIIESGSRMVGCKLTAENKCGWILCNKKKNKFQVKKTKCGKCKLIRYCSRNHQKKHWKYIHSQQCLQYN
eukprot:314101_1